MPEEAANMVNGNEDSDDGEDFSESEADPDDDDAQGLTVVDNDDSADSEDRLHSLATRSIRQRLIATCSESAGLVATPRTPLAIMPGGASPATCIRAPGARKSAVPKSRSEFRKALADKIPRRTASAQAAVARAKGGAASADTEEEEEEEAKLSRKALEALVKECEVEEEEVVYLEDLLAFLGGQAALMREEPEPEPVHKVRPTCGLSS